jgi:hypothetical protein
VEYLENGRLLEITRVMRFTRTASRMVFAPENVTTVKDQPQAGPAADVVAGVQCFRGPPR